MRIKDFRIALENCKEQLQELNKVKINDIKTSDLWRLKAELENQGYNTVLDGEYLKLI